MGKAEVQNIIYQYKDRTHQNFRGVRLDDLNNDDLKSLIAYLLDRFDLCKKCYPDIDQEKLTPDQKRRIQSLGFCKMCGWIPLWDGVVLVGNVCWRCSERKVQPHD